MKARKKGSNEEWKEVKYVQLEDSDIFYKEEYIEFQNISSDGLNTEPTEKYVQLEDSEIFYKQGYIEFKNTSSDGLNTEPTEKEAHWQDVRERAAIAALSGMLADTNQKGSFGSFAQQAIYYADALIKQLKKKD